MGRLTSPTFDIGRAASACALTGDAFEPGDAVVVALFDDPEAEGVLHRLDFAPESWSMFRERGGLFHDESTTNPQAGSVAAWAVPARIFGTWRTVMGERGVESGPVLDPASMLELFESLEEATDENQLAFRFVLALVLIRRKEFVRVGAVAASSEGGAGVLRVRARGSGSDGSVMEVVQPALTAERLASVTARIDALLKGGAS